MKHFQTEMVFTIIFLALFFCSLVFGQQPSANQTFIRLVSSPDVSLVNGTSDPPLRTISEPLPEAWNKAEDQEFEQILRSLFSKEFGFTLIGIKPMSLEEYTLDSPLSPRCREKLIYFLRECFESSSEYVLHIHSFLPGVFDITLIHKNCFQTIVESEPYLKKFIERYYGTPTLFFNHCQKSDSNICDCFKYDDMALGLAFGYGHENSAYAVRMMEIAPCVVQTHGLSSNQLRLKPNPFIITRSYRFPLPYIYQLPLILTPSPRFVSLDEEWAWLHKVRYSIPSNDPPYLFTVPFFIAKQCKQTEELLQKYSTGINILAHLFQEESIAVKIKELSHRHQQRKCS